MQESDVIVTEEGRTVSIIGKGIKTIPTWLGTKYGSKATTLNLSFNNIKKIDNLSKFKLLKKLVLDNNKISVPGDGFPTLPNLDTLWMNKNQITDLDSLLDILEKNKKLKFLSLMNNPCAPNEILGASPEEYNRFRLYILFRIQSLTFLDSEQVSKKERFEANKKGKFFKVKKIEVKETENKTDENPSIDEENPDGTKIHSYFGYTRQVYTGKHSEGNRFIKNQNL